MVGFILGAVAGAVATYVWRRDIQHYVEQRMPELRTSASDRLQSLTSRAHEAIDRAKESIDTKVRRAGGDAGGSGASRGSAMPSDYPPSGTTGGYPATGTTGTSGMTGETRSPGTAPGDRPWRPS
jgi:hypothetical protein